MAKHIGILTAGGDCPGLNAAIRGVGKSAQRNYDIEVIGFRSGFRGLMENQMVRLDGDVLSGILTVGGTILGTSRDKPNRMTIAGKVQDMTDVIVENYHANHTKYKFNAHRHLPYKHKKSAVACAHFASTRVRYSVRPQFNVLKFYDSQNNTAIMTRMIQTFNEQAISQII